MTWLEIILISICGVVALHMIGAEIMRILSKKPEVIEVKKPMTPHVDGCQCEYCLLKQESDKKWRDMVIGARTARDLADEKVLFLQDRVKILEDALIADRNQTKCADDCEPGGWRACMGCDARIKAAIGKGKAQ